MDWTRTRERAAELRRRIRLEYTVEVIVRFIFEVLERSRRHVWRTLFITLSGYSLCVNRRAMDVLYMRRTCDEPLVRFV